MADLHTRLLAAVQQRMDVARAAANDTAPEWFTYERYILAADPSPSMDPEVEPVLWLAMDGTQSMMDHIRHNDPATVLRHCERDLKVLERHKPVNEWAHIPYVEPYIMCEACAEVDHDVRQPWPCPEIDLLATAYGIDP